MRKLLAEVVGNPMPRLPAFVPVVLVAAGLAPEAPAAPGSIA